MKIKKNPDVAWPTKEESEQWAKEIKAMNFNPYSPDAPKRESFTDQYMERIGKAKKQEIKNFKPISISELTNTDFGEYKYLVANLIPREGITLISASPKSGKSWLVLYIMLKIAKGEPVFELETSKSKILFVDEENTPRGLKRRIGKLTDDLKGIDITFLNKHNFKLDQEADRKWLKEYITNNAIDVVVFDSFRRIHSEEENSSDGIAKVYDYLKDIMTTGVAIILIDHNRKFAIEDKVKKISMESIRGSSDKYAIPEAVILLQTKDLEDKIAKGKVKRTIVLPELRESADVSNFAIEWADSEDGSKINFDYKGQVSEEELQKNEAKELIRELMEDSKEIEDIKTIKEKLPRKIGDKNIRVALKELVVTGFLTETKGKRGKLLYSRPFSFAV